MSLVVTVVPWADQADELGAIIRYSTLIGFPNLGTVTLLDQFLKADQTTMFRYVVILVQDKVDVEDIANTVSQFERTNPSRVQSITFMVQRRLGLETQLREALNQRRPLQLN